MKILKEPNRNWEYQCTCEKCDAELLIEAADVQMMKSSSGFSGGGGPYLHAICEACKSRISIPANLVPKIIVLELERAESSVATRNSSQWDNHQIFTTNK
jgi:hypothetical protein